MDETKAIDSPHSTASRGWDLTRETYDLTTPEETELSRQPTRVGFRPTVGCPMARSRRRSCSTFMLCAPWQNEKYSIGGLAHHHLDFVTRCYRKYIPSRDLGSKVSVAEAKLDESPICEVRAKKNYHLYLRGTSQIGLTRVHVRVRLEN